MTPKQKKVLKATLPYIIIAFIATTVLESLDFSLPVHPLLIGVGVALIMAAIVQIRKAEKGKKKYRKGIEHGSARWGTAKDIKPFMDTNSKNNIILTTTEALTMNSRPKDPATARNKNLLVMGGAGSGKTWRVMKPGLMQCDSTDYPCSFVITDPKGELLRDCGYMLRKKGYSVKVLNTINMKESWKYNPLDYIRDEKDVLTFVAALMKNTNPPGESRPNDPFWEKAEQLLYMALISYVRWYLAPKSRHLGTVVKMLTMMETSEGKTEQKNAIDKLFDQLATEHPDCFAVSQYKKFKLAAGVVTYKRLIYQAPKTPINKRFIGYFYFVAISRKEHHHEREQDYRPVHTIVTR